MPKGNGHPFVRVRNLEDYQHYKDRRPTWVKLYNNITDDYDFASLPDASKWLALGLVLLASRTKNHIPFDPDWIARELHCTETPEAERLLDIEFIELCPCSRCASKVLAEPEQEAIPEREVERETEVEREQQEKANEASSSATSLKKKNTKQIEITWRIEKTWEAHTKQREDFFLRDTERKPPPSALTEARRKLIADALHRWDSDFLGADQRDEWLEKSWVLAAGVGIFFDEFMTRERHLNPERCWKIHNGIDQVERFGLLYFELAGAEEESADPGEDYPWAETEGGGVKCLACTTRMGHPAAHACERLAAMFADGCHPQQTKEA